MNVCFCYRDIDSDPISHLYRRYWNDDLLTCIRWYCQNLRSGSGYRKCLQENCPSAIIRIPTRDLDSIEAPDEARRDDSMESVVCAFLNCPTTPGSNEGPRCAADVCNYEPDRLDSEYKQMPSSVVELFVRLDDLCKRTVCRDISYLQYPECFHDKCVSAHAHTGEVKKRSRANGIELYRKRRVNDEVSQCMQSYCGGKRSESRIYCIIKNCHRPSG